MISEAVLLNTESFPPPSGRLSHIHAQERPPRVLQVLFVTFQSFSAVGSFRLEQEVASLVVWERKSGLQGFDCFFLLMG